MRLWRVLLVMASLLPRAARAAPPSRAEIQREVRRLLGRAADVGACRVIRQEGATTTVECVSRRCAAGCQVLRVFTTLVFEGGRARVTGRRERRLGDTGECGCCTKGE